MKPIQPVIVPPPTPSDEESSSDTNMKVNKRSIEDMTSTPAIRNSKNELRAELMRLEAEKEQLEVDRQRIDDDRVSFLTCLDQIKLFKKALTTKRSRFTDNYLFTFYY